MAARVSGAGMEGIKMTDDEKWPRIYYQGVELSTGYKVVRIIDDEWRFIEKRLPFKTVWDGWSAMHMEISSMGANVVADGRLPPDERAEQLRRSTIRIVSIALQMLRDNPFLEESSSDF
jgi:hypothetical protein